MKFVVLKSVNSTERIAVLYSAKKKLAGRRETSQGCSFGNARTVYSSTKLVGGRGHEGLLCRQDQSRETPPRE